MSAFVPHSSLIPSTRLQGGLRSLRNVSVSAGRAPTRAGSRSATLHMTGEYGITLQNLIYTPTTSGTGIEDKDTVCYMVWKQVFGNAYVMESERAEAYVAESMYRAGQIPLREFVRGVALSATYRRRFFECCGPYRAVELNFKHLLGRGPNSQQELSEHVQRIANEGFEAEINSYIDSEEYEEAFGDDFVPYMRFKGTYRTAEEFNRMCALASFPGTTDKSLTVRARQLGIENPNHVLSLDGAGIASRLVSPIAMNTSPSYVAVKKAIPIRPDIDIGRPMTTVKVEENPDARTRYEIAPGSYMYLTKQEFADMNKDTSMEMMITSYAQKEIADAKNQIAALEAKIMELTSAI